MLPAQRSPKATLPKIKPNVAFCVKERCFPTPNVQLGGNSSEVTGDVMTNRSRLGRSDDNLFMDAPDWDDPAVEEHWCDERRRIVTEYLANQGLVHGEVGAWPAWHIAPYVSIWAVESLLAPDHVGWWAICGDLPTDYLSAATIKHPRKALLAFAEIWKEVAGCMVEGVPHPDISIGPSPPNPELASLLESRSDLLRRFAEDDSLWGAEYD
jgi:hypothetical protein